MNAPVLPQPVKLDKAYQLLIETGGYQPGPHLSFHPADFLRIGLVFEPERRQEVYRIIGFHQHWIIIRHIGYDKPFLIPASLVTYWIMSGRIYMGYEAVCPLTPLEFACIKTLEDSNVSATR